jgi:transcriptional regulator with XRE-family HTH domain
VPRNQSVAPVSKAFGAILKRYRCARGITQEELAHRAEIDISFVSRMERGLTQPSVGILIKIAAAFDTSGSKLMAEIEKALPGRT